MDNKRTMFRVCKGKNNPYVMLNKRFLNDATLSWKAKGILAYLLSLPDDWKIYEDELVRHSTDGKDSLRSGIKELIEKGYIVRNRIRDEKGRLRGYEYSVYEDPNHIGKTVFGFSKNGFSKDGKPETTNNELTNNELTDNDLTNEGEIDNYNGAERTLNPEIYEVIQYYFARYKEKFKKEHPPLKTEQYRKVHDILLEFMEENWLSKENLLDMVDRHFERSMKTDYNINHFATIGVLTNIMYESAY